MELGILSGRKLVISFPADASTFSGHNIPTSSCGGYHLSPKMTIHSSAPRVVSNRPPASSNIIGPKLDIVPSPRHTYFLLLLSPPHLHGKQVAELGIFLLGNVNSLRSLSLPAVNTKVVSVLLDEACISNRAPASRF